MKFNSNQRTKVIQGLRSFKDTLPTKIKKIVKKKGEIYSEIIDNWRKFIGKDLFDDTYPKSFKNSNKFRQSYLEIMTKRGQEVKLEYNKNRIIQNINSFFGYKVIHDIKIISFEDKNIQIKDIKSKYINKNNFKKIIKDIKSEELKKSMDQLIKSYKKR